MVSRGLPNFRNFASIDVGIKVAGTERDVLGRKLANAISQQLNKGFRAAVPRIKKQLQEWLRRVIKEQPEYAALVATGPGSLREHFGLVDGPARMDDIIEVWVQSLFVTLKPIKIVGDSIQGGIQIGIFKAGWVDVLRRRTANFTTEKKENLPWLEWLLLRGDQVIISDYHIAPGRGRAGGQIMVQKGSWSVPVEFRGTDDNNFANRAVLQSIDGMENIINAELSRTVSM